MLLARAVWLIRLATWWLRAWRRRRRRPPARVAFLLEAPPPELDAPRPPFWQRFVGRPPLSIDELARQLRSVTAEPRVRAVLLHLRPMELAASQVDALREVVAGVRVSCWAPSYTASTYLRSEEHTSELQALRHLVCRL